MSKHNRVISISLTLATLWTLSNGYYWPEYQPYGHHQRNNHPDHNNHQAHYHVRSFSNMMAPDDDQMLEAQYGMALGIKARTRSRSRARLDVDQHRDERGNLIHQTALNRDYERDTQLELSLEFDLPEWYVRYANEKWGHRGLRWLREHLSFVKKQQQQGGGPLSTPLTPPPESQLPPDHPNRVKWSMGLNSQRNSSSQYLLSGSHALGWLGSKVLPQRLKSAWAINRDRDAELDLQIGIGGDRGQSERDGGGHPVPIPDNIPEQLAGSLNHDSPPVKVVGGELKLDTEVPSTNKESGANDKPPPGGGSNLDQPKEMMIGELTTSAPVMHIPKADTADLIVFYTVVLIALGTFVAIASAYDPYYHEHGYGHHYDHHYNHPYSHHYDQPKITFNIKTSGDLTPDQLAQIEQLKREYEQRTSQGNIGYNQQGNFHNEQHTGQEDHHEEHHHPKCQYYGPYNYGADLDEFPDDYQDQRRYPYTLNYYHDPYYDHGRFRYLEVGAKGHYQAKHRHELSAGHDSENKEGHHKNHLALDHHHDRDAGLEFTFGFNVPKWLQRKRQGPLDGPVEPRSAQDQSDQGDDGVPGPGYHKDLLTLDTSGTNENGLSHEYSMGWANRLGYWLGMHRGSGNHQHGHRWGLGARLRYEIDPDDPDHRRLVLRLGARHGHTHHHDLEGEHNSPALAALECIDKTEGEEHYYSVNYQSDNIPNSNHKFYEVFYTINMMIVYVCVLMLAITLTPHGDNCINAFPMAYPMTGRTAGSYGYYRGERNAKCGDEDHPDDSAGPITFDK
ncbi:unnamed protein product [Medioppia subpectinata]|uniref:Uncharacterized protein n=1 Tax=Medioppia subpectinata TaxID=1979941 RepID=A0A7R9PUV9_9ACAR|nr:unnamed protein product [Medioppia subpectinata]CAG2101199.1 unnamed protein product [Medioppia subpectinata]